MRVYSYDMSTANCRLQLQFGLDSLSPGVHELPTMARALLLSHILSCPVCLLHVCVDIQIALPFSYQELTRLGDLVLRIVRNFSKDENCHKHLIGSKCIHALLPFCFSHRIQTNLEAKCIVASLYLLLGPSYSYFLKLFSAERDFFLMCLPVAASDENRLVEVATGKSSRIKYSASELAAGLSYLLYDEENRTYFAQKTEIFLSISLLLASSEDDQVAAMKLLYKLVAEPGAHDLIRDSYPDVIYRLMSLHENGSALLKEKARIILTELDLGEPCNDLNVAIIVDMYGSI